MVISAIQTTPTHHAFKFVRETTGGPALKGSVCMNFGSAHWWFGRVYIHVCGLCYNSHLHAQGGTKGLWLSFKMIISSEVIEVRMRSRLDTHREMFGHILNPDLGAGNVFLGTGNGKVRNGRKKIRVNRPCTHWVEILFVNYTYTHIPTVFKKWTWNTDQSANRSAIGGQAQCKPPLKSW